MGSSLVLIPALSPEPTGVNKLTLQLEQELVEGDKSPMLNATCGLRVRASFLPIDKGVAIQQLS